MTSAGIATVENGHLERRRAEGKLRNLEHRLLERAAVGAGRHRPHALGDARPADRAQRPSAHDAARLGRPQRHHRELSRPARASCPRPGHTFETDTDTEAVVHLITHELDKGRRAGRRGASAALRPSAGRFRARHHFRRPRRSDDRRAAGQPARHRPRRRRDVPGLGRHRAGAVHRQRSPIWRKATGRCCAAPASRSSIAPAHSVTRPLVKSVASALLVDKGNHRHFMAKEIHEQPDVISHTLANYLDMGAGTRRLSRHRHRSRQDRTRHHLGLRHRLLRGPRRQVLDRALRARARRDRRRLRVPLSRRRRCSRAAWRCSSRSRARRPTRWRRCATARRSGQHIASIVNVRTSTIARESDAVLPTLAGPEIGVASTKAFTCQLAALACLAIAIGRARGHDRRRRRSANWSRALTEMPRLISTMLRDEQPVRGAGAHAVEGARRAVPRPRHQLPPGAGGRAQAQGDLLHPRRRLCGRRAEARPHRADRRERAGHRHGAGGRPVREDRSPTCRRWRPAAARSS